MRSEKTGALSTRKTWTCRSEHRGHQQAGTPLLQTQAERVGLFSLEKRKLWGDFVVAFQYLKGANKKDGERLFTWEDRDETRRNHFKIKEGGFR